VRTVLLSLIARALRLASIAICLIAIGWFAAFALDQTSSASNHQQAEVNAGAPPGLATETTGSSKPGKESGLHEALDKTTSTLTSPFSSVTASLSKGWTIHVVDTLLMLLVYGLGLGFLARLMRFGL
jgi:hypothetical protein